MNLKRVGLIAVPAPVPTSLLGKLSGGRLVSKVCGTNTAAASGKHGKTRFLMMPRAMPWISGDSR